MRRFIKIDIAGFEEDLFSKCTEWIDAFPVLMVELHDGMLPGEALLAQFSEGGRLPEPRFHLQARSRGLISKPGKHNQ